MVLVVTLPNSACSNVSAVVVLVPEVGVISINGRATGEATSSDRI